jgi:hypothetical protein
MADKVIKSSLDKKGIEYYPITTANAVIHASKHKTIDVITDDLDKKSITIPYYAEFESGGTVSVPISDFEKDLGISWEDFCKYTTTVDILIDSSMLGGETNENYIDTVFTKHFTIYLPEIEGDAVEGVAFHKMNNFQLSWDSDEDPPESFLHYQILEFYRQGKNEYIQINQYKTSCYDEITTQLINPAILKSESTIRTEISDTASQLKNLIDNVIYKAAEPSELPIDASLHSIGVIPKIVIKTKSLYDSLIIKNDNYISISDIKINPVELNGSIDPSWWPILSGAQATKQPITISFYTATGPEPYTEMRPLTSLNITYEGGGSWRIIYPDSSCLDEKGYSNTVILRYGDGLNEYNQDVYDEFKNVLAGANNVYINAIYPIDLRNNGLIKHISDNGVIECDIPIKESLVYLKEEDGWQKYYSPIKDKSITNEKLSDKINSNLDYINQELKDINSTIIDYHHFVIPIELNSDVNLQSGVEYNSNEHFNINEERLGILRYILLPENTSKFYINRITIDLRQEDKHTFAPLSTIYNSSVENESGELENWINFVFIIYSEEYDRKFIVSFNEENYIKLKVYEF